MKESESRGLRQIDENKLNALLDHVPEGIAKNIIRRSLPTPSRARINTRPTSTAPAVVRRIIQELGLLDVDDVELRAKLFIGYMRSRDLAYNTAQKYYASACRLGIFDDPERDTTRLRLDPTAFEGRIHTRIMSVESYVKLYAYLTERWSEYTAPLLLAFHTGLRTMEVLQFTTHTLYQLSRRDTVVDIVRKRTVQRAKPFLWQPIYDTYTIQFVEKLKNLYSPNFNEYTTSGINTKLFHVTPRTLINRLRTAFYLANGFLADRGIGLHTCRYMHANMMAVKSKNLDAIRAFLQHKSLKTTQRYLRNDLSYASKKFNEITKNVFAEIHKNLIPPSSVASANELSSDSPTLSAATATVNRESERVEN